MEAKDTVMTSRDAVFDPIQDQIQRLLICQAEISFKVGERKVVEWIESHSQLEKCDPDTMAYFNEYRWIDEPELQEFLKSEGIE